MSCDLRQPKNKETWKKKEKQNVALPKSRVPVAFDEVATALGCCVHGAVLLPFLSLPFWVFFPTAKTRMIMPVARCVRSGTNPHPSGQIFSFICLLWVRSRSLLLSQAVSVGVINEKLIMNVCCLERWCVSGSPPPLNSTLMLWNFCTIQFRCWQEFRSTTLQLANLFHW